MSESMTAAQYQRLLRGKQSKVNGQVFEDIIETACEFYKRQGLAHICKQNEPLKPIQSMGQGRFLAVFTKQSQPDYMGVLAGGRTIVFEAKQTDNDRILQNAVQPYQAENLDIYAGLGALCFILVSLEHKFYRVPWSIWRDMKLNIGHKYMNAKELQPYEINHATGFLAILSGNEVISARREKEEING